MSDHDEDTGLAPTREPSPSRKRPAFVLSTEGKTREQMKAEARQALREALRKAQDAQQQEDQQ